MGRGRDLVAFLSTAWKRTSVAAAMTILAYGLVLIAVRHAPVGYVAALRESSVLIAVFVGSRYLGEGRGQHAHDRRRADRRRARAAGHLALTTRSCQGLRARACPRSLT